ncbi:DUF2851 family protein [Muricauda sp. CAU 1633]|uniref:DUF2851 family protein n=1 Tax=Allomuricauda sp. CAU 1633 TaxID=2816036 RepID=UPI001A8DEE44|nr:DUF2851 family protein [Muricauda sp. CAU 1633]MBO0322542.1 DUF2851 family protein [Muricauda sp. CAU 1633]
MKEDLLHFIWGQKKLHGRQLTSTTNEAISIKAPGVQNQYSGPDFFNAKIEIATQMWVGNVEIHLKSSDWYAHNHQTDSNYNNVILHVVWEDDIAVFRKDGSVIPTLELREYVPQELLRNYQNLLEKNSPNFINCEKDFAEMDSFLVEHWLHRLYIERLEQKSNRIEELLKKSNNDWEGVLFTMLARNFGSKVNGDFFLDRAIQLEYSTIRKISSSLEALESLLLGHFGLLQVDDCTDRYFLQLQKEHKYLSRKFNLPPVLSKPEFFGLRPANFPTIRTAQLAHLYAKEQSLFSQIMEASTLEEIQAIFEVAASKYWDDHYTFGKTSKKGKKKLSKSFIDLLVINTIVPLKFCYSRHIGVDWNEALISLLSTITKEKNSIIGGFDKLGSKTNNAMESQAKIQLHTHYCSKNKCLRCALGTHLLNRNT